MSEKYVFISGIRYNIRYKIGQGQQGSVYCIQSPKGELFALKQMDILNEDFQQRMYKEITLHYSCKCENIIKFVDSEEINGELYIILELGECNLSTYLQTKEGNTLDEKQLMMLIKDVSTGLVEIHKNQIMHRDIKADNIIISGSKFKISDFGVSGEGIAKKTFIGTPIYLAPEVLSNQFSNNNYNYLVDVWALGVISFEVYFGVHPFYHNVKDKYQMNFDALKRSMNLLIDKNGFHIERLIQKLKNQGMRNKATFIESKMKNTSLQSMKMFKDFWDRAMTLDPSIRINAQNSMKMFNFSNRVTLFKDQVAVQNKNQFGNIKNSNLSMTSNGTMLSSQNSFTNNSSQLNLRKTQSYNHTNIPPSQIPSFETRNRQHSNPNILQQQQPLKRTISLYQIQTFIQSSKTMVLQLSNSFSSVMNIKQLSYLNPCLIALQMLSILYLNKGGLSRQDTQKFMKTDRKQQQKMISQTFFQATKLYKQLISKYPLQHFLAQVIFRLQLAAIFPKLISKINKLMQILPQLFPTKSGFQQYEQNQTKIHNTNLNYFQEQLKSL